MYPLVVNMMQKDEKGMSTFFAFAKSKASLMTWTILVPIRLLGGALTSMCPQKHGFIAMTHARCVVKFFILGTNIHPQGLGQQIDPSGLCRPQLLPLDYKAI